MGSESVSDERQEITLDGRWEFDQFFTEARRRGYLYDPPVIDGACGTRVIQGGRRLVNFAGINFLGLQEDPEVIEYFCNSAERFGLVTGGSRMTQGIGRPHTLLEKRVSEITGKPATLTFATGLLANIGFLNAMTTRFAFDAECAIDNRDVVLILDHDSHWSLWKGASHLEYGKRLFVFRHNDPGDLRRVLQRLDDRRTVVVFESVYSSDGSIAPIGELVDICEHYGALSYVDNANGFSIYGISGLPFCDVFEALHRATFEMGSFSKAAGLEGGFISGPSNAIGSFEALSGTSLFTASIQPPTAATILRILDYIYAHPEILKRYLQRVEDLRQRLLVHGFRLYGTSSYILSIIIGEDEVAEQVRKTLLEQGYQVPIFRYPAVKRNAAVMRLIINARHTEEDIEGFLQSLLWAKDRYRF